MKKLRHLSLNFINYKKVIFLSIMFSKVKHCVYFINDNFYLLPYCRTKPILWHRDSQENHHYTSLLPAAFSPFFARAFYPFFSFTHPFSFFFTFYQDRRARRERGRVHDQGHERHEEGPGVPEQGQEEEDYDHVVHDHRRKPRVLHWTQIPGLPINKYNDSYTICLEILWIYTSEGHLI